MSPLSTITNLLNEAAKLVGGRAWGAEVGRPRIYLQGFNHRNQVWIEFPDAGESDLGGAVVRGSRCPQFHRWSALAVMALQAGDRALADMVLQGTCYDVTDAQFEELASLIENGQLVKAREAFGLISM